jgi:NADH:ubiquinone oxidoreductase subunit 4 (subunit M)
MLFQVHVLPKTLLQFKVMKPCIHRCVWNVHTFPKHVLSYWLFIEAVSVFFAILRTLLALMFFYCRYKSTDEKLTALQTHIFFSLEFR